jgi:hypothetical protein
MEDFEDVTLNEVALAEASVRVIVPSFFGG